MVEEAEPRSPTGFQTRVPSVRPSELGTSGAALDPRSLRSAGLSEDQHAWLPSGLIAAGLVAILIALYGGILRGLVGQWWDDASYSHGFVVPLFSAFLAWQRRDRLQGLVARGSWFGFAVLLGGVAMLLVGDLGGENFLMRSSLIVVLAGLILFHLGREFLRVLAFPLLFLFFAVPLPATLFYAVAFPLQNLAARNAAWILDFLGVPVLLDGNVIHLSQISLGVTEACSGIRSLISLLAAAAALAALTAPGPWGITALVASVFPVTVIANAGRVVTTGLIGQYGRVDYAEGFFHGFSGWLVFLLAFACLLGVQRVIRLGQTRWRRRAP